MNIKDNLLIGGDISYQFARGEIRNNVLLRGGITIGRNSARIVIEDNTLLGIRDTSEAFGPYVIRGNVLQAGWPPGEGAAIRLYTGDKSLIQDNVIGCREDQVGIHLGDVFLTLIEGNLVNGCDVGLRLGGRYNTYRNNVFRNSTTAPVLDEEVGNIDAGGNVY
jgi:hypothetical protein